MEQEQPTASSSYMTIIDLCETQITASYPISDVRSCSARRGHANGGGIAASQRPLLDDIKYSIPMWREIEAGVWSDGTERVLSAGYPAVQEFLATARRTLRLPLPPSEAVFVIAALEVFYAWNDPVHWMFWSDEKKNSTAAVVNRIVLRKPQVIRSKVSWNGEAEYLFILSGLHGTSSLPVDKDWYHILNPAKASTGPMNLRKRKAAQEEGPGKKRTRSSSSSSQTTVVRRSGSVTSNVTAKTESESEKGTRMVTRGRGRK